MVNERIKLIRKTERLSQEVFGKRLGITKSSVSLLESGKNSPSEQTIKLICSEFHIMEEWLRYGKGTMKEKYPVEDEYFKAATLISKNKDTLAMQAIIDSWKLEDKDKQIFRDYIYNIAKKSRD